MTVSTTKNLQSYIRRIVVHSHPRFRYSRQILYTTFVFSIWATHYTTKSIGLQIQRIMQGIFSFNVVFLSPLCPVLAALLSWTLYPAPLRSPQTSSSGGFQPAHGLGTHERIVYSLDRSALQGALCCRIEARKPLTLSSPSWTVQGNQAVWSM